ncbi:hypothetical protein HBH92_198280 [Parastagonospora nodorum]|nr:hypothetical protein HBH92_198280 [Parastagonospora nodorum]KAH4421381.1 hypothetical protein HBH93_201460 [Parastagonospora nodorum]KAH4434136.1 hypothetical protein HBH91_210890 [Parastagonospora nodorum]KAH4499976.1 hypothetical protein HBH89_121250 [Parastagonospora nodorum]KAH4528789.1 hypothetical protein HBH85_203010 [Parastagonospora nodorum]
MPYFRDTVNEYSFQWIDPSSIESLMMHECDGLEILFKFLLGSAKDLQIKQFTMEDWTIQPELLQKSPDNIEKFLNSFSGLMLCKAVLSVSWSRDLDLMSRNHRTIDNLVVNFGDQGMNMGMLKKNQVPYLRISVLGFWHRMLELPTNHGAFEDKLCDITGRRLVGFDSLFMPIADKFVEFPLLDAVEAIYMPGRVGMYNRSNGRRSPGGMPTTKSF